MTLRSQRPRPWLSMSSKYNDIQYDSMKTEPLNCNYFQINIGSTWYPNSPISVSGAPASKNVADIYYYANAGWHKTNPELNPTSVDFAAFLGVADGVGTSRNPASGVMTTSFVKSQVSQVAGIMTNNSRACVVEAKFAAAPTGTGASRRLDNYLKHLRHCRVFLSNVVVSD